MNIHKILKYGTLVAAGACSHEVNNMGMEPEENLGRNNASRGSIHSSTSMFWGNEKQKKNDSDEYVAKKIREWIESLIENVGPSLEAYRLAKIKYLLHLQSKGKIPKNDKVYQVNETSLTIESMIITNFKEILNLIESDFFCQNTVDKLLLLIVNNVVDPLCVSFATSNNCCYDNEGLRKIYEDVNVYYQESLLAFAINTFELLLKHYPDFILESSNLQYYSLFGGLSTYIAELTNLGTREAEIDKLELFYRLLKGFFTEKQIPCSHLTTMDCIQGKEVSPKQQAPLSLVFSLYMKRTEQNLGIAFINRSERSIDGFPMKVKIDIKYKEFLEKYIGKKIPDIFKRFKSVLIKFVEMQEKNPESERQEIEERERIEKSEEKEREDQEERERIEKSEEKEKIKEREDQKEREEIKYKKKKSKNTKLEPEKTINPKNAKIRFNENSISNALKKCLKISLYPDQEEVEKEFDCIIETFKENVDTNGRLNFIQNGTIRGSRGDFGFKVLHGGMYCIKVRKCMPWFTRFYFVWNKNTGEWTVYFGHIYHNNKIVNSNKSK